jgi:xanthine dehydrogenase/oxidase
MEDEAIESILPILLIGTICAVCYVVWREKIDRLLSQFFGTNSGQQDEERVGLLMTSQRNGKLSFQEIPWSNRMNIQVNGQTIEVVNPDPTELLATYIRDKLVLKGTKLGCEEGGCGACSIVLQDPRNNTIKAVNSCLRLLCANDGQSITTVEGIGSVDQGLSDEQRSIVEHSATQCGYCTPGWVTAMHALKEECAKDNKVMKESDIDDYFDGNLCRCTGYRPIMKAFHSLCGNNNGSEKIQQQCSNPLARANPSMCNTGFDMEDMTGQCEHPHPHSANSGTSSVVTAGNSGGLTIHRQSQKRSTTNTKNSYQLLLQEMKPLHFFNPASGKRYLRPVTFDQLCACLKEFNSTNNYGTVKILGGNTSIGVTKYLNNTAPYYYADEFLTMIDINRVGELNVKQFDSSTKQLTIGAGITINECIQLLRQHTPPSPISSNVNGHKEGVGINHHSIFSVTANHLHRIANTQVRNAASWAGNLMIFLQYKSFPSDAVLALTNAFAVLRISDTDGNMFDLPMDQFLTYSYETFKKRGLFIVSMTIPDVISNASTTTTVSETFKVAQREHNAHAYVDAGFNFQLLASSATASSAPICSYARIVFGGVGKTIFIASQTEQVLRNAPLNARTLGNALAALQQDLATVGINDEFDNKHFLVSVMQSNLYLIFLRCYQSTASKYMLPSNVVSALMPWVKPSSRGVQVYPVNRFDQPQLNPVGKAVKKLEAPIQATGEAIYPSDEVVPPNGYQAEIVYSTKCAVTLVSIDASAALQINGVMAVYTAADIPGENSIGNGNTLFVPVGSVVPCVGAPLAVIVATTEEIATRAASLVKVTYGGSNAKVISNLQEAMTAKSFYDVDPSMTSMAIGDASAGLSQSVYRAKGRVSAGGQYHFYMETQTAIAQIVDGSVVKVICGSQDPSNFQTQISNVLGLPSNKVN